MSEIMDPNRRGRPLGRWRNRNRMMVYMCEKGATRRGGLEQAKCLDREIGDSSAIATS